MQDEVEVQFVNRISNLEDLKFMVGLTEFKGKQQSIGLSWKDIEAMRLQKENSLTRHRKSQFYHENKHSDKLFSHFIDGNVGVN